jgi:quinol monooxygenase YgiN
MFFSLITIYPFPGDESKIIDVLDSMQGVISIKADCQGCLLTVEAITSKSICYMERWRTREALDRHLRSTLYCRVMEAMELSRLPPKVEFYEITGIGGLDLIEHVRLKPVTMDTK